MSDSKTLANAVDKQLVKIIDEGVTVPDGNGGTVVTTAPASYFKAAVERLKMLGDLDPAMPGTAQADLLKRAEAAHKRLKLAGGPAPIDVEEVERRA